MTEVMLSLVGRCKPPSSIYISGFCRTSEDAETLPCIVTVATAILQTIQDHSLTLVDEGDLIDHPASHRILHVSGIASRRST